MEATSGDEGGDVDPLLLGPSSGAKGSRKSLPQTSAMNLLVETIERIKDRFIRVEGKIDDMYDVIREVKREQQGQPMMTDNTPSVQSEGEELPTFDPPAKKKKPIILGIPFVEVKRAFEGKHGPASMILRISYRTKN